MIVGVKVDDGQVKYDLIVETSLKNESDIIVACMKNNIFKNIDDSDWAKVDFSMSRVDRSFLEKYCTIHNIG